MQPQALLYMPTADAKSVPFQDKMVGVQINDT
jgi:hypothetical protein